MLLPVVDAKVRATSALQHGFRKICGASAYDGAPQHRRARRAAEHAHRHGPGACGLKTFWPPHRRAACAVALLMDDVSLMTYTSGTTGLPAGDGELWQRHVQDRVGRSTGTTPHETLLAVAPLYHHRR